MDVKLKKMNKISSLRSLKCKRKFKSIDRELNDNDEKFDTTVGTTL